jgi:hypothetical protein
MVANLSLSYLWKFDTVTVAIMVIEWVAEFSNLAGGN